MVRYNKVHNTKTTAKYHVSSLLPHYLYLSLSYQPYNLSAMSEPSVDGDGGDDHDINDEDLDAFLVLIESRLRADWTSPDLSRIIASQGSTSSRSGAGNALTTLPSGNPSSASKFLRLIKKVFHLAAKPIKLRALMSVLGLESDRAVASSSTQSSLIGVSYPMSSQHDDSVAGDLDGKKTDKIICELLQKAELDDEMWVRVVAGILRGMMFQSSSSSNRDAEPVNHFATDSACRGTTAEEELKKITNAIMQSVREAAKEASADKEDVRRSLLKQNNDESQNGAAVDEKEGTLATYPIKDSCPSFAPLRYSLLPADTIRSILPEADDNSHFKANMDASIFKVDAEIEDKRAEEESKETNLQKRTNLTNVKSNITSSGKVAAVGGRPTNGNLASNVTGNRADTAMMIGRAGRGRFSNGAGRVGGGGRDAGASLFRPSNGLAAAGRGSRGRGALAGRSGTLSRLAGAGRGAGRGVAAATGKAPLSRRVPGSKQVLLNSAARGTGDSSKMKMIDVSEVQGLNRAQKEREQVSTKEARKRKLMEDAKASGLRKEKKARDATNSGAGTNNQSSSEGRQGWESLLEKSNKCSDDDLTIIRNFFEQRTTNPTNPLGRPAGTDESGVWRCKLNEEKQSSETGELVKETLYLDLDYNTLGYKKTRKIKKK